MNARTIGLLVLSLLLLGGGLIVRYRYSNQFHQQLLNTISQNIDREFSVMDTEATELLRDQVASTSPAWDKARHFFVLVDSNRITSWNRNYFLPDFLSLSGMDTVVFITTTRGDFVIKRWPISPHKSLYGILKLTDRYPIINNFLLSQWESSIFPVRELQISGLSTVGGEAITLKGKVLFRVLPEKPEVHESAFSFLLLAGGTLLLLLGLWRISRFLEKRFSYDAAFALLLLGLLGIRQGMISLSLPALYLPSDVFDPKKFASSSLNASLGDLFFNSIALLILVGYLFLHFRRFQFVKWLLKMPGIKKSIAGMFCLWACFYALLFPFDFIEAIYHNSTLSLDLTQSLSFDIVRIIALASILIGCLTSFLVIHIFFLLAEHLFEMKNGRFLAGLLSASVLFVLQFLLSGRSLWATLLLAVAFFLVLKLSRLNTTVLKVSYRFFIYLTLSLIVFSLQNGWAVRTFYKERQVQDQFRFGKDFLTERDVLGEYLLDQVRQRIETDQFIQLRMARPFLSRSVVVDKIRRVHLSNYFDRYETDISTHSAERKPEDPQAEKADSIRLAGPAGFQSTGYEGIYYANASEGGAIKRYHVTIPISYQRPVGWVTLDLSLKRVIPENVYPELLVDNRFNQIYRNRDFSYAVFKKDRLVSSFGPFNYERDFQLQRINNPSLYKEGITDNLYNHVGIEAPEGSVAVISASTYSWFYFVTNFSFWFVLGLAFLFTGQGILAIVSYFRGEKFNYTARIQLFIFFAFLLPVLAVSITTMTLIGKSSEEAIQKDFLERSTTLSQRIANLVSTDSLKAMNGIDLESWLEENAASSKTDISVYSPDGKLMATSQPGLFEDQLISPLMDRGAWKKIVLEHEAQTVTNEQIGKLQYSCAYSAVLSPESGRLEAIVGLPFFESATFLQRSQLRIISNILIVFVVVFILFSMLSFWASSSLTFPIRFITKRLGQTTLTGQNKPLEWNSSDEIGTLVKEYNRMVENLEESKRALALSEKESAWREMAKQVAHEIKNPLTPMKLTLQQMEMAMKSGNLSMDKSERSLEVLLKQVEILNEIASSFSAFAMMPAPSPAKVELSGLLQGSVNLFAAEAEAKITYLPTDDRLIVSVDPTSFSRAISNIIINAIQAKKEGGDLLEVSVTSAVAGANVVTTIRDNGRGMSKEVQEKIFQPQFTTKQSGSGLGLALTKQIIVQAGGRIWFESLVGQGTTFYIQLPLAV